MYISYNLPQLITCTCNKYRCTDSGKVPIPASKTFNFLLQHSKQVDSDLHVLNVNKQITILDKDRCEHSVITNLLERVIVK